MNVFILDNDPGISASYIVDGHVAFVTVGLNRPPIRSCKMAVEALQKMPRYTGRETHNWL